MFQVAWWRSGAQGGSAASLWDGRSCVIADYNGLGLRFWSVSSEEVSETQVSYSRLVSDMMGEHRESTEANQLG